MPNRRLHPELEELDALLAKRAIEALEPLESARLAELFERYPDEDTERYERAAAALLLAVTRYDEPMPQSLSRRLGALAAEHLAGTGDASGESR